MAGRGYVCPVCEGRGFLDTGESCTFCIPIDSKTIKSAEISDESWMKEVHEGNCCSDRDDKS